MKTTISLVFVFLVASTTMAYSQTELPFPAEFQNLTLNQRALEKTLEITSNETTSQVTQNLVLDKIGVILHLVPSPQIKDTNTRIRIFSNDGIEYETFKFIDDTVFSLVNTDATYSIIQEINPKCSALAKVQKLDPNTIFCPTSEAFRLYDKIMITKDTSFKITLKSPNEFYLLNLKLPKDTKQVDDKFNFVEISDPNNDLSIDTQSREINAAGLLMLGKLCIVSYDNKDKTENIVFTPNECTFNNKDIRAIIIFNHAFKNNLSCINTEINTSSSGTISANISSSSSGSTTGTTNEENTPACSSSGVICLSGSPDCINGLIGKAKCKTIDSIDTPGCKTGFNFFPNKKNDIEETPKLVFSFIESLFKDLNHNIVLNLNYEAKPNTNREEITSKSKEKLFLTNYTFNLKLNLGQIDLHKTIIGKNIFKLTSQVILDKNLSKASFSLPIDSLEGIINPFSSQDIESFLTNIDLDSEGKDKTNKTSISIENSIIVKNLLEQRFAQIQATSLAKSLKIASYIPIDTSKIKLSRVYTHVEQTIAPSVNEKGKPIELINNKSIANLIISNELKDIDTNNSGNPFTFNIENFKSIFDNKAFKNQFSLSGTLIPPDLRPVVEEGYRATISLFMSIKIDDNNTLKIIYSDLQTKDETPLTNFFNFSFLPIGTYEGQIKFDANREKLLKKAGIVKN